MAEESVPAAEVPQSTASVTDQARSAVAAIAELLDQLVPPESVVIRDVYGGEHHLRARIPARAQVLVMRHMEAIATREVGSEIRDAARGKGGGAVAAAVFAMVRAAGEEDVMRGIAQAFAVAHPTALAMAKRAAEMQEPGLDVSRLDAADLFGVEEMATALIPFFLALLRRLAALAGEMLAPQTQA